MPAHFAMIKALKSLKPLIVLALLIFAPTSRTALAVPPALDRANGEIAIAGAKNACLTLMPATLLSEEPLTLTNAPRLSDIRTMTELLRSLGAEVASLQDGKVLAMSSHGAINTRADYDIVRKMRASNLVLGPLLAR